MNAHCERDCADARFFAPRARASRVDTREREGGERRGGRAGTSAFAFQGTNAHCVVESSGPARAIVRRDDGALWDSTRYWPLVDAVSWCVTRGWTRVASAAVTAFRVSFRRDARDHVVYDRAVLPGAAYLVCARACVVGHLGDGRALVVVVERSVNFVSPAALVEGDATIRAAV